MTGLSLASNESTGQGDAAAQAQELLVLSDWVRYSLAGNLRCVGVGVGASAGAGAECIGIEGVVICRCVAYACLFKGVHMRDPVCVVEWNWGCDDGRMLCECLCSEGRGDRCMCMCVCVHCAYSWMNSSVLYIVLSEGLCQRASPQISWTNIVTDNFKQ